MKPSRPWLGLTVQLILTVLAIYWIATTITWAQIRDGLGRIPLGVLVAGTIVYAISTLGRVARFRMLGASHVRFIDMVAVTWVHNLYNNILPFRLGEVSYLVLTKRVGDIGTGTSAAAVVVSRIADLMGLCAVLAACAMVAGTPFAYLDRWLLAGILVACVIGGALAVLLGERLARLVASALPETSAWRTRASDAATLLQQTGPRRVLGPLLLWSIMMVALGNLVNTWTLQAVGIDLSFWEMSLALSASFLMAILPIQPVGGWGVFEGAVVLGLHSYGYDAKTAMSAGVALHVANYIYFVPLGLLGWLHLWRRK